MNQRAISSPDRVQSTASAVLQRKCFGSCRGQVDDKKNTLQRKASSNHEASEVPPIVYDVLRSPGQPLDEKTRSFFEPRFGHDFSRIKLHSGPVAERALESVNAEGFAVGKHIVLPEGEIRWDSHLLAHELVHTIQQGFATVPSKVGIGNTSTRHENEANDVGRRVLQNQEAPSNFSNTIPLLQRFGHEDCDEAKDLRPHVWPADAIARTMVANSIIALSSPTLCAATQMHLRNYFNSDAPATASVVLAVFRSIQAAFAKNNYVYECEDDCSGESAYVYSLWSDIHMCMNKLRGRDNKQIAGIVVHEFSHREGGTDDKKYFFFYGTGTAPTGLAVSDAIQNADSYEGFAYQHG